MTTNTTNTNIECDFCSKEDGVSRYFPAIRWELDDGELQCVSMRYKTHLCNECFSGTPDLGSQSATSGTSGTVLRGWTWSEVFEQLTVFLAKPQVLKERKIPLCCDSKISQVSSSCGKETWTYCNGCSGCHKHVPIFPRAYPWYCVTKAKYKEPPRWTTFAVELCDECFKKTLDCNSLGGWDWWDAMDNLHFSYLEEQSVRDRHDQGLINIAKNGLENTKDAMYSSGIAAALKSIIGQFDTVEDLRKARAANQISSLSITSDTDWTYTEDEDKEEDKENDKKEDNDDDDE